MLLYIDAGYFNILIPRKSTPSNYWIVLEIFLEFFFNSYKKEHMEEQME